jgi:thioesterase domain-containing protein
VRLWNLYGPTEAAIDASWWDARDGLGARTVPIGRPIWNTRLHVLDPHGEPVPVGVAGELFIAGRGLARGYLGRPDLTAERFVPEPWVPGGRMYRTGDRVRRLPDGSLEFLGRTDHQIKLRGHRIEPGEIEAALLRHPGVRAAVVVADGPPAGTRLVAYVVPAPGGAAEPDALRAYLRQRLPEPMVPGVFVSLEALPLGPSGKVDRQALPAPPAASPGPAFVAPRDPLEARLAALWGEVLRVPRVGVTDDFFDLGGHSLLAVRLFSQVERLTGRRLPVVTLFRAPTVAELAQVLRGEQEPPGWASLVPIQTAGRAQPFFCVHGHFGGVLDLGRLSRALGPEQPFYALQARGLDGSEGPLTSIEAMAARYLEEVRQVQPRGPYALGGNCFGALVALEMAQQLRAQGEAVGLLAIFDAGGPPGPGEGSAGRGARAGQARERWRARIANLKALGPADRLRYLAAGAGQVGERVATGARRLWDPVRDRAGAAINRAHRRAQQAYRPRPYPGRITLFRVRHPLTRAFADPLFGWGSLARGGVDVRLVEGRAGSVLSEALAPAVGAMLREILAALPETSGTPPEA